MEIFWKNEISIYKVLIKIFFLDIIILFILFLLIVIIENLLRCNLVEVFVCV